MKKFVFNEINSQKFFHLNISCTQATIEKSIETILKPNICMCVCVCVHMLG